eukprot:GEMP01010335.1.p1 GENE.GEMP01010335.1~~GEMP01010335.1.p1  ORF type:complete len:545 (-),score=107.76 GEMP01010335.1:1308-2942(-)
MKAINKFQKIFVKKNAYLDENSEEFAGEESPRSPASPASPASQASPTGSVPTGRVPSFPTTAVPETIVDDESPKVVQPDAASEELVGAWIECNDPPPVTDAAGFLRPQPLVRRKMAVLTNIKNGLNGSTVEKNVMLAAGQQKRKREPLPKTPRWPERPPPLTRRLGNNTMEKRWRVDIAHDALEFMKSRDWINWQPERLNTRYDFQSRRVLPPPTPAYDTQIVVSTEDSITAALRILIENPLDTASMADIPLVLSMAHRTAAGGGFMHGARAQEEDLCRRSDLYMALQYAKYPLPEYGCNYTFPVSVLRDSKFTNYRYLKATACDPSYFPQIGVLSAAAYKDPTVNNDWREKMKWKVYNLFAAALDSGHRILILSAWGCGAFGNPPEEISRFFKEALDGEFKGRFKQVIFGIATNKREGNLGAFLDTFQAQLYYPPKGINLDPDPVGMFGSRTGKQPPTPSGVAKKNAKKSKASTEKKADPKAEKPAKTVDPKAEQPVKTADPKAEQAGKPADPKAAEKKAKKPKEPIALTKKDKNIYLGAKQE